jgi:phosphatidylglycerol:prolipoprotein diacylglycerol transferase
MQAILGALPFYKFGPWTPIPGVEAFKIHAFGTLVAIGLLTCLYMATRRGERKLGMDGQKVQDFGLWLIVIGWIFAHVFNVLFYEPTRAFEMVQLGESAIFLPRILIIWGSISSYGGLIGGMIALWAWKWRHPDDDFRLWTDHAVWTLTFAWMFGRLGCSSVHDHLGVSAAEWWPLAFEISAYYGGGIRHDLGFYEFLWWVVIVGTVMWLDRKPRRKGLYMAIVPLMYAPVRFTLDFLRLWPLPEDGSYDLSPIAEWGLGLFGATPESLVQLDGRLYTVTAPVGDTSHLPAQLFTEGQALYADTRYLGMTPAQYLSIALFVFGLVMLWRIRDEEPIEWEEFDPAEQRESGGD